MGGSWKLSFELIFPAVCLEKEGTGLFKISVQKTETNSVLLECLNVVSVSDGNEVQLWVLGFWHVFTGVKVKVVSHTRVPPESTFVFVWQT